MLFMLLEKKIIPNFITDNIEIYSNHSDDSDDSDEKSQIKKIYI